MGTAKQVTRGARKGSSPHPGVLGARKLAWKIDPEPEHAFQVSKNALTLFDATQAIHKFGKSDRRLLNAAALLHDIGHTVDVQCHHKHSRDLILKLELPGFSKNEKRIIACVARYHRKAHPSPSHAVFADLSKKDQRKIEKLSALLRIADGLDRCHAASCKRISATLVDGGVTIAVTQRKPSPTDIWGAQRKRSLFEEVFGMKVTIEAAA